MTQVIVERNALERAIVVICSSMLWVTMVLIFVILAANTLLRYALAPACSGPMRYLSCCSLGW